MTEINLGQATLDKKNLKSAINNCFNNPLLDELQRYAYATILARAAVEAAKNFGKDAIKFALDEKNGCQPLSGSGKDFEHLGSTFRITFADTYNYDQGDELGKDWTANFKKREKLRNEAKSITDYLDGLQKRILNLHDRLKPTKTDVSISYFEK